MAHVGDVPSVEQQAVFIDRKPVPFCQSRDAEILEAVPNLAAVDPRVRVVRFQKCGELVECLLDVVARGTKVARHVALLDGLDDMLGGAAQQSLLRASVWPRWLLLEAALDHAANSGDLHLSALILRSQIEELDALRSVAAVLSRRDEGSWDGDAMVNAIRTLTNRVLPRLQSKTEEQLVEQSADPAMAATRPEPLQRSFDRLSEYVHPNYGSHVLSVRPHGVEVAKVFVEAFVAIYKGFLSLPWAKDGDDICPNLALPINDDSVDLVITNSVPIDVSILGEPGVQSTEIRRILVPGGQWMHDGRLRYVKP